MAHTGLFVAPVPGTPPVGATPTDGRLVLGGVFGTKATLVSGGGYTPSASALSLVVNQAVWNIPDVTNSAAAFLTLTDATTLTFGPAPATGGRVDSVVIKQNNVENGDTDSRSNVYVHPGVASGSPVAPALAAGESKYLDVLINAGTTNLAAATVTNWLQSTFLPPWLSAPSVAGLPAAGLPGQHANVTGVVPDYEWNGTAWVPVGTVTGNVTTFGTGYTGLTGSYTPRIRQVGLQCTLYGAVQTTSGIQYGNILTVPSQFQPPSTDSRYIGAGVTSTGISFQLLMAGGVVQTSSSYISAPWSVTGMNIPLVCSWWMD